MESCLAKTLGFVEAGEERSRTALGAKRGWRALAEQETVCALCKPGVSTGSGNCLPTALPATETPESWGSHGAGTPSSHSFPSPLDRDAGVQFPGLSWIFACLIKKLNTGSLGMV